MSETTLQEINELLKQMNDKIEEHKVRSEILIESRDRLIKVRNKLKGAIHDPSSQEITETIRSPI